MRPGSGRLVYLRMRSSRIRSVLARRPGGVLVPAGRGIRQAGRGLARGALSGYRSAAMPRPTPISGHPRVAAGLCAGAALADEPMTDPSYHYRLRIPCPVLPPAGGGGPAAAAPQDGWGLELMMATWTPGLLPDPGVRPPRGGLRGRRSGRRAPRRREDRRRTAGGSRRPGAGHRPLHRVYCHELSVRTNFVDDDFALLNGAATFLVPAGRERPAARAPSRSASRPPDGWRTVLTPLLPEAAAGTPRRPPSPPRDYDTLVDSPLYAGTGRTLPLRGRRRAPPAAPPRRRGGLGRRALARPTCRRSSRPSATSGAPSPIPTTDFLNLIVEAGGGLEHADLHGPHDQPLEGRHPEGLPRLARPGLPRAVPRLERQAPATRPSWRASTTSGRSTPAASGSPRASPRTTTTCWSTGRASRPARSTWSGCRRTSSASRPPPDASPSRWTRPPSTPGSSSTAPTRTPPTPRSPTTPRARSSPSSWTPRSAARAAASGAWTTPSATAWARFARGRRGHGLPARRAGAVLEREAGTDLDRFLEAALGTVDELDYERALDWLGLRFTSEAPKEDDEDDEDEGIESRDDAPTAWLGADTQVDDGRLVVSRVPRETPAAEAGLSADDEILAIGGFRVPPRELDERLEAMRAGDESTLLVARRERLIELPVTFGEKPAESWKLEIDPDAGDPAETHREAWLGTPDA